MNKIIFLDAATVSDLPAYDRLRELGDFTAYDRTPPERVLERLSGAQVAITNKVPIDAGLIGQLPDLRLICVAATGTNHIDAEAAAARGIPVRNVAGYSTASVAQLTITSLFTLAMDLIWLNNSVHDGSYSRQPDFTHWRRPFYELGGATYGIIGLGTIGHAVARLATAYGAKIIYHSTSGRNTDQPYPQVSLDELLDRSDVVSIHCGLNDNTRNLIGERELGRMKDTAYLLNLGRGGIVREDDLARALDANLIAGAAVDVFTREPLPKGHPFLSVRDPSRLLLTPHVAWASVEARTELLTGIVANVEEGW